MAEHAILTLPEALTEQFYAWEKRGRGWFVWPEPVTLEPPFRPFFRYLPTPSGREDDARTPGLLERLWKRLRGDTEPEDASVEEDDLEVLDERAPAPDENPPDLVEIQVGVPEEVEVTADLAERLLLGLGASLGPVSFEIVGLPERIALQFTADSEDAAVVRNALETYVPDVLLTERRGFLRETWNGAAGGSTVVVDFGLSREFMLPLSVPRSLAVDPLLGFVSALQDLRGGELGLLQVLFERTAYPWAESARRAITDGEGSAFFADAPETLRLTAEKTTHPLFAAVIRVGARAETETRAWQIARSLGTAFAQFSNPSSNELIPLENDEYPSSDHEEDILIRRSRRSGMLLSSEELAALVHVPGPSVRTPSLRAPARRTRGAPPCVTSGEVVLGENAHRGKTVTVKAARALRLRHTHVIGATGTGKSTLLKNLIRQDIEAGRGVGLLDPHGDLVEDVLASIPENRVGDVVLFDPSDEEYPIGFNILRAHSAREKDLLASDLVAIFRRFSTSWGDQMTAVLGNAILAFLESDEGGTLVDLRRFLVERKFRDEFLRSVRDPQVQFFWEREFPLLLGRPQVPILTRLDAFLRPRAIRFMVAQKESRLDLGAVMDEGKIFLAKLAQGAIGEENAHLLGSLLVSKLHQMTLSREGKPEAERRDFFLYLDEFHHFATPSLGSMLSGARKYHVGLTLAHQELRQLQDSGVQSAVLTNPATRICFRLGDEDARKLADGFASFEASDLQNLGVGEALCRIERADQDFNLRIPVLSGMARKAVARRDEMRDACRARYGCPAADVEKILQEAFGTPRTSPAARDTVPEAARPAEPKQLPREIPAEASPRTGVPVEPEPLTPSKVKGTESKERDRLPLPGRGGPQHKYLQSLLKHFAEEKGFRATVEAALPNGGHVDLLLERDGVRIAVEISITSTPEQEIGNLEKCLGAGIGRIAVVSPERRVLKRVEALARTRLLEGTQGEVSFVTPEEFLAFLDGLKESSDREPAEATVLGYRVKTKFTGDGRRKQAGQMQTLARTVVQALKRLASR